MLQKQRASFEARAIEYDVWWDRDGRYDLGPGGTRWGWQVSTQHRYVVIIQELERAAGACNWAPCWGCQAEQVTLLEASCCMIEANRRRIQEARPFQCFKQEETELTC